MQVTMKADSLTRFVIAFVIAMAILIIYNRQKIDAENAALGAENHAAFEIWRGRRITAQRPTEIATLIAEVGGTQKAAGAAPAAMVLWLGNSQLHTINQYKAGEHLAPYWLAEEADCNECLLPLGVSLPNANIQEHLVIAEYAMQRLPLSLIAIKLVFDDLREDGLRDELEPLLPEDVRSALSTSEIGKEMLATWNQRRTRGGSDKKQDGLEGFVQKHIEERLDKVLSAVFPMWAERGNLRARVALDLYDLRNTVLRIKPASVRRMIPSRYDRNMRALEQLSIAAHRAKVPLLVYVAPIRNDVPIPYDVAAYNRWLGVIDAMGAAAGFKVMNLERLVPNDRWGSIRGDDVDYMHFQGSGHKLLADALWPEMRGMISANPGAAAHPFAGRAR